VSRGRRGAGPRGGRPRPGGRLAAALLAGGLAAAPGCATLGPALASLRPLPRPCEGALVPVDDLGPDFALQARYRARSRGREEALLLAAEKRGARLVLLGLDPLGTHVFTVVQEGASVRREQHLRPLFPFAPENALRDLVRARFEDRLGTAPDDARVERHGPAVRIVRPSCAWEAALEVVGATP
jgi:hypothetical protein